MRLSIPGNGKLNAHVHTGISLAWSERRHFLSHLCIKTKILPRQARDRHRVKLRKEWRFSQEGGHMEGFLDHESVLPKLLTFLAQVVPGAAAGVQPKL